MTVATIVFFAQLILAERQMSVVLMLSIMVRYGWDWMARDWHIWSHRVLLLNSTTSLQALCHQTLFFALLGKKRDACGLALSAMECSTCRAMISWCQITIC